MAGRRFDLDPAAVRGDDLVDEGQAEPGTVVFLTPPPMESLILVR